MMEINKLRFAVYRYIMGSNQICHRTRLALKIEWINVAWMYCSVELAKGYLHLNIWRNSPGIYYIPLRIEIKSSFLPMLPRVRRASLNSCTSSSENDHLYGLYTYINGQTTWPIGNKFGIPTGSVTDQQLTHFAYLSGIYFNRYLCH